MPTCKLFLRKLGKILLYSCYFLKINAIFKGHGFSIVVESLAPGGTENPARVSSSTTHMI